jgi:hypothetical protein
LGSLNNQAAQRADRHGFPHDQSQPDVEHDEERRPRYAEEAARRRDDRLGHPFVLPQGEGRKPQHRDRDERDPRGDLAAPGELRAVQDGEHDRPDHAHSAALGRRRESEEDRAEDEENQH